MYQFLLKQFLKQTGRKPNNLENILLKQKASKQAIDERKIVSMSDRSSVNPNKPILGGKNIEETEEQIRQRLIDQNKKGIESLRNKNKPDDMATGGRAGYAVGNQVMPAVDQRMNLDYNTLVDQNTAQRGTQAQARNSFQKHFDNNQLLKNAVSRGELSSGDYNRLGGFDVAQTMGGGNPVLGGIGNLVGSTAYNAYQSIKDGQPILEGIKDIGRNVQGGTGLISDDLKAQYESIINQKAATPTSNEIPGAINSLINVNKPTMADVAGRESTYVGPYGDGKDYSYLQKEFLKDPTTFGSLESPLDYAFNQFKPLQFIGSSGYPETTYSNQNISLKQLQEFNKELQQLTNRGIEIPQKYTNKINEAIQDASRTQGLASGGRAGYYGGGQAMVGEDLSEIGHGSDALMARNMQIAPGGQATTSTGLNYLLGQDNDTVRIPYAGGGMSKRAFLKLLGAFGAGAAGLKSGILGLGKGAGKEVVKEVAKEAATGGAPPHFLKLVAKIKALGDDVTETAALADRQTVKKYKDFELTEDVSTGEIQIFKNSQSDEALDRFASENANEEVFMRYKPGKGQADETTKGKAIADEYEENTSYISNNRENTGEILEEISGVPDDIFKEVGEAVPEALLEKEKQMVVE